FVANLAASCQQICAISISHNENLCSFRSQKITAGRIDSRYISRQILPDRAVRELLPERPPTVVGHGILGDTMLYLTARRAEDGMLFRVFLNPDDLRRLLKRAMEQEETAAIVREIAGSRLTPVATDPKLTSRFQPAAE